ncbi:prolipoprotein diacylglyceryl transferase family protein [Desulfoplanes sp.]
MNLFFIFCLTLPLIVLFVWGFKHLPEARWQMLGAIPMIQKDAFTWQGINLTFYGVFNAFAYVTATALAIVLFESVGVPPVPLFAMIIGVLGICMPASKIIAAVVEKKPHTFSVGGATFVGIIVSPWLIQGINLFTVNPLPVIPVLSVVALVSAMGEGLGRMACISFGCCYGRPVTDFPSRFTKLLTRYAFVFQGSTKKISYAHHLDGQPVIPVQGMTAVLSCGCALIGIYLFLEGYFTPALILSIFVTQIWRFLSEFLRNDYRGGGFISAYQIMALVGAGYVLAITLLFSESALPAPDIVAGLAFLWSPGIILGLQVLGIISFLYTGKSNVTDSIIEFRVRKETI